MIQKIVGPILASGIFIGSGMVGIHGHASGGLQNLKIINLLLHLLIMAMRKLLDTVPKKRKFEPSISFTEFCKSDYFIKRHGQGHPLMIEIAGQTYDNPKCPVRGIEAVKIYNEFIGKNKKKTS